MIVVVIVLSWLWLAKIWGVFILWVIFLNFWHNFLEASFHTTSNFFNFKNLCDPIVPETFCCNIRHQCPGLTDLNCRRFWWRLMYQPGGQSAAEPSYYVPAECMYFSWNMQPKCKIIIKYQTPQAKFDRYMKLWISANTNEPQKKHAKKYSLNNVWFGKISLFRVRFAVMITILGKRAKSVKGDWNDQKKNKSICTSFLSGLRNFSRILRVRLFCHPPKLV